MATLPQNGHDTEVESETSETIEEFCQPLHLPEQVIAAASQLWHELNETDLASTLQENKRPWHSIMVYLASIDTRLPYGVNDPQAGTGLLQAPCTTVTDLLRTANIKLLQFCQLMNGLRNYHHLSDAVHHHFVCLERKYLISLPLFHKFERLFKDAFHESGLTNGHSDLVQFTPGAKLSWALFVYIKASLWAGSSQGLMNSWYLLLCCISFVMRKTPSFQLKAPFDASVMNADDSRQVLETVCSVSGDAVTEVNVIYTHYFEPILHNIIQEGACDYQRMMSMYYCLYKCEGDIDELLFLQHDATIYIQPPPSEQNNNSDNTPDRSPAPEPPMTPVQAARSSAQQLRNLLQSCGDRPSQTLVQYFQKCCTDPTPEILSRLSSLQQVFMDSYMRATGDTTPHLAKQLFFLATKLYYRVMEAMLKTEEARLSIEDFGALLGKDVFHRCLLACSVVVVMETNGPTPGQVIHSPSLHANNDVSFPWILNVLGLKAYDFFKVPESFIKAESKLPKEAVKALQQVETMIIESLAWEDGSPLYEALSNNEPWRQSVTSDNPPPANTPAELYLSPFRSRTNVPPNTVANLAQNTSSMSPRPTRRRSHALQRFLNKTCRLAHGRIMSLGNLLDLGSDVKEKVWTCMEHCILNLNYLLKNRHLDQIMLCCIYSICKVLDIEKKFKAIVGMYKELPHGAVKVYKRVYIRRNQYDSIISFYNSVFMEAVKSYVLQFSSSRPLHMSPAPKSTPTPVFSVAGRKNFYVSPMKGSPFKTPLSMSPGQMTPRTRQLYCFGDNLGSAEKLRSINDRMHALSRPLDTSTIRSSKRLLDFDPAMDDGDEDGESERITVVKRARGSPSSRKSLLFHPPS